MMRMGPFAWPMEERAHRIIGMGRVSVAEPSEWLRISADRVKLFNRNLNVNDWLRFQTRNGRRTMVIDSTGQLSQRTRNSVPFRFELKSPAWIVGHDLQSLAHNGSRLTLRFGGSPTQLNKEAHAERVRCKRLFSVPSWERSFQQEGLGRKALADVSSATSSLRFAKCFRTDLGPSRGGRHTARLLALPVTRRRLPAHAGTCRCRQHRGREMQAWRRGGHTAYHDERVPNSDHRRDIGAEISCCAERLLEKLDQDGCIVNHESRRHAMPTFRGRFSHRCSLPCIAIATA